jgi:hypothetical protein
MLILAIREASFHNTGEVSDDSDSPTGRPQVRNNHEITASQ